MQCDAMDLHVVLFLTACIIPYGGARDKGSFLLKNLLQDDNLGTAECDAGLQDAKDQSALENVDGFPMLMGSWASQSCETHSGPTYILRSVVFRPSLTFKFTKYYYYDSSCTKPSHSLTFNGTLTMNEEALTTFLPQARVANYNLKSYTLVTKDRKIAKKFKLNNEDTRCLFPKRHGLCKVISVNLKCTNCSSDAAEHLDEFKLIMTQKRTMAGRTVLELLLGKILGEGIDDLWPSFYPPLRYVQRHGCKPCLKVAFGSELSPPRLKRVRLPAYLQGEWVSQRCEVAVEPFRFILRRAKFDSVQNTWSLIIMSFKDYACSAPRFIMTVSGSYVADFNSGLNTTVDGASNLGLTIDSAQLNEDAWMILPYIYENKCLLSPYTNGMPMKLKSDCVLATSAASSKFYHSELDAQANPLLYLGPQVCERQRCAYYQPPLVQCSGFPSSPVITYIQKRK